MKSLSKLWLTFGVAVLTFFALATSASACFLGTYQPEEPKSLRD